MPSGYKISGGTDLSSIFEAQNYVTGFFNNNIVTNPYFNTPTESTATNYTYITDLTTITGWTFSYNIGNGNRGIIITKGINPWSNRTLPWNINTQALSIQYGTSVSQTGSYSYTVSQNITIATAGTYIVSFYACPRPDPLAFNVSLQLTCSFNGSSVTTAFTTSADGWNQYIFVTTLTTTTYPLVFVFNVNGASGNDTSISITGITIVLNSVISPNYTATNFKLGTADLTSIFTTLPVSNSHIYSSLTGFKNSSGSDLNTIFQWGGYTATASYSSTSITATTISFTVSGTYKYVTVNNTSFNTLLSYTYSSIGLTQNTSYTYIIKPYNGFNTFNDANSVSLTAITLATASISSISSTTTTISFTVSGTYNYIIVYNTTKGTNSGNITTNPYNYSSSSLTPNTSYAFSVTAVNDAIVSTTSVATTTAITLATASISSISSTATTISFTVSGTYNYIIVYNTTKGTNSGNITSNPYSYSSSGLTVNSSYAFSVTAVNDAIVSTTSVATTTQSTLGLPTISSVTLNSISATSSSLITSSFTVSGTYSYYKYSTNGGTTINASSVSVSNTGTYSIIFYPYNATNDQGTSFTKTITFNTSSSNITTTPSYYYAMQYVVVGGGGSGGTGGRSGDSSHTGGGGAGGGSGGYIHTTLYTSGTNTTYTASYTIGAGGAGQGGQGNTGEGNSGNAGSSSTLTVNGTSYTATGGGGGYRGNQEDWWDGAVPGGTAGSPGGVAGISVFKDSNGTAGGSNGSGYGSGSAGGGGSTIGGTGGTSAGGVGYIYCVFYYVSVT